MSSDEGGDDTMSSSTTTRRARLSAGAFRVLGGAAGLWRVRFALGAVAFAEAAGPALRAATFFDGALLPTTFFGAVFFGAAFFCAAFLVATFFVAALRAGAAFFGAAFFVAVGFLALRAFAAAEALAELAGFFFTDLPADFLAEVRGAVFFAVFVARAAFRLAIAISLSWSPVALTVAGK